MCLTIICDPQGGKEVANRINNETMYFWGQSVCDHEVRTIVCGKDQCELIRGFNVTNLLWNLFETTDINQSTQYLLVWKETQLSVRYSAFYYAQYQS